MNWIGTKRRIRRVSALYASSSRWDELLAQLEHSYAPNVIIEYSGCSIPGWNGTLKKAGRGL